MAGKERELQKKQFINGVLAGKTKQQAALDVGYTNLEAANKFAQRVSNSVQYKSAMAEALDKAGATRDKMAARINEALDAKDERGKKDWRTIMDATKLGCQINKDIGSTNGNDTTVNVFGAGFIDRLIDAYCDRQAKQA